MEEEQPQKHQSSKSMQPGLKATPVLTRQPAVRQSFTSSLQHPRVSQVGVIKTTVKTLESDDEDDDWSDVSELQEINPRQLQSGKDQNGNVDKRDFGELLILYNDVFRKK